MASLHVRFSNRPSHFILLISHIIMCFVSPTCSFLFGVLKGLFIWLRCILYWWLPRCLKHKRSLDGAVVVVTGGGGGLGRQLALQLAEHKATLVLVDVDNTPMQITKQIVEEKYPGFAVYPMTCDVSDFKAVQSVFADIIKTHGHIDVLINNAATVNGKTINELSETEIRNVIGTNLMGYFWTIKAVLEHMITEKKGHIVCISSMAGVMGTSYQSDYCASKFGIIGLMESLDVELHNRKAEGVNLSTVLPYYIRDTTLFEHVRTRYNCLMPQLSAKSVAKRVIHAIQLNEEFVVLPVMCTIMLAIKGMLPIPVMRHFGYLFGAHKSAKSDGNDTDSEC